MRRRRTLAPLVSACVRSVPTCIRPRHCLYFIVLCLLLLFHFHSSLIAIIVIEMKFETGDEKLKDLELGVFVGSGRFLVEKGKPAVVEYKISKVVQGT